MTFSRGLRARLFLGAAFSVLSLGAAVLPVAHAQAQEAGVIAGTVTDSTGAVLFQGAEVILVELGRRTVSDDAGGFRFTNVPAGEYTLRVLYVGAEPREIRVQPGQTVQAAIGAEAPVNENILVIGQRATAAGGLSKQRSAGDVRSVVTSDFIGQFPDQNATEAAQRVSGVAITRDQGEGRFVVIRGVDPNLNATTLNGLRLPSAEGDQRQVALDVIPSELIETLSIVKSLTPDRDADAIGGVVELELTSAFDRPESFLAGRAEGSYNELESAWSPRLALAGSTRFGEPGGVEIGVAGAISWFRRDFGSDNVENGDGLDDDSGLTFPGTIEARDYTVTRERLGISLNADVRTPDGLDLFLRSAFNDFRDEEIRAVTTFEPDPDGGASIVGGSTDNDALLNDQEVEQGSRFREETQQIWAIAGGFEKFWDSWRLRGELGYAEANEDNPGLVDVTHASDNDVQLGYRITDSGRKIALQSVDPLFFDPANYELDEVVLEDAYTEDSEWSVKLDIENRWAIDGGEAAIQFGGKARLRQKSNDVTNLTLGDAGLGLTIADHLYRPEGYRFGPLSPLADPRRVLRTVRANAVAFLADVDDEATFVDSNVDDYEIDEDVYAAYLMGTLERGALRISGGLRLEHTDTASRGQIVLNDQDTATLSLTPVSQSDSYTDLFPSVNIRYELDQNLIARAAYSRGISRPIFEQQRPGAIVEIDGGDVEAEAGNPGLKPFYADSFDLSLEYYPAGLGVIQAGFFAKLIENPTFVVDLAGVGPGVGFDEYITFINGDEAEIFGFELNWQQALSFLPEPLDGFLIAANYTYTHSETSVPGGGRDVMLPFTSQNVANLSLGYEKHGFSARIALSYRSEFLEEIGDPGDPAEDVYTDSSVHVDLTAAYDLTERVKLYFEGSNLTDEPYYRYRGSSRVNEQYEEYGATYAFGIRVRY